MTQHESLTMHHKPLTTQPATTTDDAPIFLFSTDEAAEMIHLNEPSDAGYTGKPLCDAPTPGKSAQHFPAGRLLCGTCGAMYLHLVGKRNTSVVALILVHARMGRYFRRTPAMRKTIAVAPEALEMVHVFEDVARSVAEWMLATRHDQPDTVSLIDHMIDTNMPTQEELDRQLHHRAATAIRQLLDQEQEQGQEPSQEQEQEQEQEQGQEQRQEPSQEQKQEQGPAAELIADFVSASMDLASVSKAVRTGSGEASRRALAAAQKWHDSERKRLIWLMTSDSTYGERVRVETAVDRLTVLAWEVEAARLVAPHGPDGTRDTPRLVKARDELRAGVEAIAALIPVEAP